MSDWRDEVLERLELILGRLHRIEYTQHQQGERYMLDFARLIEEIAELRDRATGTETALNALTAEIVRLVNEAQTLEEAQAAVNAFAGEIDVENARIQAAIEANTLPSGEPPPDTGELPAPTE
jgi:hypothetical protein